jgi:hypothetical protein
VIKVIVVEIEFPVMDGEIILLHQDVHRIGVLHRIDLEDGHERIEAGCEGDGRRRSDSLRHRALGRVVQRALTASIGRIGDSHCLLLYGSGSKAQEKHSSSCDEVNAGNCSDPLFRSLPSPRTLYFPGFCHYA